MTAPASPGDRRNTVTIVSAGWEALGFSPDRGAVTDVQMDRAEDGTIAIVEVDLYLNFQHFQFSVGPRVGSIDLSEVLLHETGHALGLLHPCELSAAPGVPACASQPDASESALFPTYGNGATAPSADDLAGLCFLYSQCVPACPSDLRCEAGACLPAPCAAGTCPTCSGDACVGLPCTAAGGCDLGSCSVIGTSVGSCLPVGSTGTACEGAADCASGLCLTSSRLGRFCTIDCTEDDDCGVALACLEVGGRAVCAPPSTSSSCSTSPTPASPLPVLAMGLAAIFSRVRSRRRLNQ